MRDPNAEHDQVGGPVDRDRARRHRREHLLGRHPNGLVQAAAPRGRGSRPGSPRSRGRSRRRPSPPQPEPHEVVARRPELGRDLSEREDVERRDDPHRPWPRTRATRSDSRSVHGVWANSSMPGPEGALGLARPLDVRGDRQRASVGGLDDRGELGVRRRRAGLRVQRDLDRGRAVRRRARAPPRPRPRGPRARGPSPAAPTTRGRVPARSGEHRAGGPDQRPGERRAARRRSASAKISSGTHARSRTAVTPPSSTAPGSARRMWTCRSATPGIRKPSTSRNSSAPAAPPRSVRRT